MYFTFVSAVLARQNSILSQKNDKNLFSKVLEDMVGRPQIVFTFKVVVRVIHIRKSTNVWKTFVATHVSQLLPYSMYQPMHTRLYARYEFDAALQRFKLRQNKI